MPTIKRLKDQKKPKSERYKERQQFYQKKCYRDFANWYKRTHIWCEECLKDGLYTPCEHLHHIQSVFEHGLTKEQQLQRLMDESNAIALCRLHHQMAHGTASQRDIDAYNERVKKLKENDNEGNLERH